MKALQFANAANTVFELADEAADVADAFITLAVHAGIAAADVLCCVHLGRHARPERHDDAVTVLETADREAARYLDALLDMKSRAGYSHTPASRKDLVRADRAMRALVAKMGDVA